MSTQAAETVTSTHRLTKERKPRRNFSIRFDGVDGAQLRIGLHIKKDGTAKTQVVHVVREGKKKRSIRGATETHATQEAAKAAQDKLAAQAVKMGWVRKERTGGFQAQPDAFDAAHLPSPKAKK